MTWYYLYATRDWTYFMKPFFGVVRNNEVFSQKLDTYVVGKKPSTSDHLNGIIFEQKFGRREDAPSFASMVNTCEFLARRIHGKNNLEILAERYTNMLSYANLKQLTSGSGDFNSIYGSEYGKLPDDFRFPHQDWVDDYDFTGSYDNSSTYPYNLGQAHAIDDFDEDSVWFYITMVTPVEQLERVIEIEDIMPFVFWWQNRGSQNNGPIVDCYGVQGNAKLNYDNGYCYSNAYGRGQKVRSAT